MYVLYIHNTYTYCIILHRHPHTYDIKCIVYSIYTNIYSIYNMSCIFRTALQFVRPVVRFGAIRTLNTLAQTRPQTAARCNCDMEPLLSDQNRNTATLALTTLLKTGHESNVERLVKQISSFMSDITEVFKVEVVRAVKGLCLLYPGKYKACLSFGRAVFGGFKLVFSMFCRFKAGLKHVSSSF